MLNGYIRFLYNTIPRRTPPMMSTFSKSVLLVNRTFRTRHAAYRIKSGLYVSLTTTPDSASLLHRHLLHPIT